ncbi:MAG TPA: polysaccharide biosynthesis protein [Vicinamibacterales bacterium]|nr:polysaccharide biosynthesis protein [Vicinamibacterales bacterium]
MTPLTDRDIEAILGRPVCRLLTAADRRAFAGRRVLITGAGGSIGSELARQVAACAPARLTLIDHAELNLFQIEQELARVAPAVPLDVVLADVAHTNLEPVVQAARPDVVYHAAAYKHVTMVERAVCAAADTNVLGTAAVVDAASRSGARFVLISSDKASRPHSVMGATKRLSELTVMARADKAFQPIVVRFGNVLGSSGSVLQLMRDAIRQGRPVPITDPDATRYFMSAGEAVSLVMKATLLSRGAETYWLDMGQPVRIGDIAARVLALEAEAGHPPTPVAVIGLRPGEKLREELTTQGLRMCRTRHRRIWVARQRAGAGARVRLTEHQLRRHVTNGDALGALGALAAAVPEFLVSETAWAMARSQSLHIEEQGSRPAAAERAS